MTETMVERMYTRGRAVDTAPHFEIDGVIDPKGSRSRISGALRSAPRPEGLGGKERPCVDTC